MTAAPYEVYVLFENMNITGKYITNLYAADDIPGNDLKLPSSSNIYFTWLK